MNSTPHCFERFDIPVCIIFWSTYFFPRIDGSREVRTSLGSGIVKVNTDHLLKKIGSSSLKTATSKLSTLQLPLPADKTVARKVRLINFSHSSLSIVHSQLALSQHVKRVWLKQAFCQGSQLIMYYLFPCYSQNELLDLRRLPRKYKCGRQL